MLAIQIRLYLPLYFTYPFINPCRNMATLHDFQTLISAQGDTTTEWASWTKSSCASVRPRPNASQSSISQRTADTMQLLNILYPTSAPSSMYCLSQVIGHTENGHQYSCVALEKWIRSKTNISSGSREEVQNGPSPHATILFGSRHSSTQTCLSVMIMKSHYRTKWFPTMT